MTGMGLHTGRTVTVSVRPAQPDYGIAFRRTDRFNIVTVPALATSISETARGTTIGSGRHNIATIEHLMSALHGCGIDNALIELDGGEVPILDGSARPWLQQITRVAKSQEYYVGVINLRGEVVPIMSLRRRFDLEEIEFTHATRIIIVRMDDQQPC